MALAGLEFRRGQRLGCEGMYYMVKVQQRWQDWRIAIASEGGILLLVN
jgi:hypothetical protein